MLIIITYAFITSEAAVYALYEHDIPNMFLKFMHS